MAVGGPPDVSKCYHQIRTIFQLKKIIKFEHPTRKMTIKEMCFLVPMDEELEAQKNTKEL